MKERNETQNYHVKVVNNTRELVDEIINSFDAQPYRNYDYVSGYISIDGVTELSFNGEGVEEWKQLVDMFYINYGNELTKEAQEYAYKNITTVINYGNNGDKCVQIEKRFVTMGNTYVITEYR